MSALACWLPAFGSDIAMVGTSLTTGFHSGPGVPTKVFLGRVDTAQEQVTSFPAPACMPHCLYTNHGFWPSVAAADVGGASVVMPYLGILPAQPGSFERGWGRVDVSSGVLLGVTTMETVPTSVLAHPFLEVLLATRMYLRRSVEWWSSSLSSSLPETDMALSINAEGAIAPLALSRDGADLYTIGDGRLFRIDALTRRTVLSRDVSYLHVFQQALVVDPYRDLLYTIDYVVPAVVAFDRQSLDEAWRIPLEPSLAYTAMLAVHAVDPRGRLLVDVRIASPFEGKALIVDPDRRVLVDMVTLEGSRFLPGGRSGRLYRIGWSSCVSPPTTACRSDVLHEYDAGTLALIRRIRLDNRPPDDPTRDDFFVELNWIAFVPRAGTAIEFHHAVLDHYFVSADPAEIDALDRGLFSGWKRTGEQFPVMLSDAGMGASRVPVCRYYGRPERGLDSHFYSASARECAEVAERFGDDWMLESHDVFQVALADAATGACPAATVPVHRLFNARRDANHRYTTSAAIKAEMIGRGYIPEGYGPDAVAFCVAG